MAEDNFGLTWCLVVFSGCCALTGKVTHDSNKCLKFYLAKQVAMSSPSNTSDILRDIVQEYSIFSDKVEGIFFLLFLPTHDSNYLDPS